VALSCELSPLVYAELYRLLAGDTATAEILDERLRLIELEHGWLSQASERYEAKWQGELRTASNWSDMPPLGWEHARLASWVLAALRARGSCFDLGTELRNRVTKRVVAEITDLPSPTPSQWKPVVFGWTLGMVAGDVDRDLPAVPPEPPADENVRAAYAGLVEHMLLLGKLPDPWPEMAGTSVHWRGSGLAEAMQPDAPDGQAAITQLVVAIKRFLPEIQGKKLGQHFSKFVEQRNTLTHIADSPGRPPFSEIVVEVRTQAQVHNTVMGVTQLLFSQVSSDLAGSRVIHARTWDYLKWELEVYSQ